MHKKIQFRNIVTKALKLIKINMRLAVLVKK